MFWLWDIYVGTEATTSAILSKSTTQDIITTNELRNEVSTEPTTQSTITVQTTKVTSASTTQSSTIFQTIEHQTDITTFVPTSRDITETTLMHITHTATPRHTKEKVITSTMGTCKYW